jgi:hypothetical protein
VSRQRLFADVTLLAAALASAGAGLLALETARSYQVTALRQALVVGGPLLLAALLLVCLRLPLSSRIALSMTLISLAVAAYAAEGYLRVLPKLRVRMAARRFGLDFDGRKKLEVVEDLRRQGRDAWPAAFPAWEGLKLGTSGLLPLGGISNVATVFCNEMGPYLVYDSDEHGFRNPKGLWSAPGLEIALLGDSFTQGACVPAGQDFASLVRQEHPSTLNLGMLGNGPLLMLAGLKEYLPDLRPGHVLWVYTEGNDLVFDLNFEKRYPLLMDYLTPGGHQDLRERQSECDALLRRLIEEEYATLGPAGPEVAAPGRFWKLWALRQSLGLFVGESGVNPARADFDLFRRILEAAQQNARAWGGEVTFVYLPSEGRYFDRRARRNHDQVREKVVAILDEIHLPWIDLDPAFSGAPDVSALFAYPGGHLSPEGNRLVAEAILRSLRDPQKH